MKPDIEYFAGLFDGEGFVRIDDHFKQPVTGNARYTVHAGVAMTHMPVVKLFYDRWGGCFKGDDSFKRRYNKNRVIYRWSITSQKAFVFLLEIQKHTHVKRTQIDIAIDFQRHIDKWKSKMVGAKGDLELRKQLFLERAVMCEQIRQLKKEEFPLVVSDPEPLH